MRRQALLNLFMLLLVGALALVVLYGPEPDTPPAVVQLGPENLADVARIELALAEAPPLVLIHQDGRWSLPAQPDWRLDDRLITQVVELPRAVSHARYPLSQTDAAELGLAPPRLRLRLDDIEYRFGAQEPIDRRRYVRLGDTVHLITDTLVHQLSATTTDWVSRRLLPEGAVITALELPGVTLSLDAEGRWQQEPAGAEMEADTVNAFVDRWRHARAFSVSPYEPNRDLETVRVRLQSKPEPLVFELIRGESAWFLQRPDLGLRYELEITSARQLLEPPQTRETR